MCAARAESRHVGVARVSHALRFWALWRARLDRRSALPCLESRLSTLSAGLIVGEIDSMFFFL